MESGFRSRERTVHLGWRASMFPATLTFMVKTVGAILQCCPSPPCFVSLPRPGRSLQFLLNLKTHFYSYQLILPPFPPTVLYLPPLTSRATSKISTLQMRRLSMVHSLAQGHTALKYRSYHLNPDLTSETHAFNLCLQQILGSLIV